MKLILEFKEFLSESINSDMIQKMDTLREFSRELLIDLYDKEFVIQVTPIFGTREVNITINCPFKSSFKIIDYMDDEGYDDEDDEYEKVKTPLHLKQKDRDKYPYWDLIKDNIINFIIILNEDYEISDEYITTSSNDNIMMIIKKGDDYTESESDKIFGDVRRQKVYTVEDVIEDKIENFELERIFIRVKL